MVSLSKMIFRCPECGKFYCKPNMVSTGKGPDKVYSDGRVFAKMLPEHIIITRCTECKTLFWFDDNTHYRIDDYRHYRYFDSHNQNKNNIPEYVNAVLISLEEFIMVLQTGFYKSQKEELYLREYIRWLFNDRVRFQKKMFADEVEISVWTENLYGLIRLYESKSITHLNAILKLYNDIKVKYGQNLTVENIKNIENIPENALIKQLESKYTDCLIKVAEIYRNLSNFEFSLDILNNIEAIEYQWIKEQIKREGLKKNEKVFRLRSNMTVKVRN